MYRLASVLKTRFAVALFASDAEAPTTSVDMERERVVSCRIEIGRIPKDQSLTRTTFLRRMKTWLKTWLRTGIGIDNVVKKEEGCWGCLTTALMAALLVALLTG
jgi:hypothetical protein